MRSKFIPTGPILVSEIQLDQNNYRLGPIDTQKECIAAMFSEFKDKMIKIAAHIAQNGLSPRPIVVVMNDQGRWVVRDGNRRVTALKLLNNPAEAPEEYLSDFQSLRMNATPGMIPHEIDCLTADEMIIKEYLKLEHMGPQDGIGQVDWDARAKENMQADIGGKLKYKHAKAICDYLIEKNVDEARNVKISNIQRFFQDTDTSSRLGIAWTGETFVFTHKEDEVFDLLKAIMIDFTKGGKGVKDIYYQSDRMVYIDNLFGARGFKQPTPLENPVSPSKSGFSASSGTSGSSGKNPVKTKAPWERARVIQRGAGLTVPDTEKKLRTILVELSSKINVRDATVAAAVLVRIVIERSVEFYAQKNSITLERELHKNINKVAEKMYTDKLISKKELEQLKKMSNSQELISAHTLNAWVHSPTYIPDRQSVCTFWDNIYFMLVNCWK